MFLFTGLHFYQILHIAVVSVIKSSFSFSILVFLSSKAAVSRKLGKKTANEALYYHQHVDIWIYLCTVPIWTALTAQLIALYMEKGFKRTKN